MTTDETPTSTVPLTQEHTSELPVTHQDTTALPTVTPPTDLPTTSMTAQEAEAMGVTDAMTRPLVPEQTPPTQSTLLSAQENSLNTVWHRSDPSATASSLEPPSGVNAAALSWGLVLTAVGGLIIASTFGARIELLSAGIVVIGGLGAVLLVMVLIPRKKDEPQGV